MIDIHRKQRTDPNYTFVPALPPPTGTRAEDKVLEYEAALTI
jgi:hypothetical protein